MTPDLIARLRLARAKTGSKLYTEAAAALSEKDAEIVRLNKALDMVAEEREAYIKLSNYWAASATDEKQRAERAEAEREALRLQLKAAHAILRVCKGNVHPNTAVVIDGLIGGIHHDAAIAHAATDAPRKE